MEVFLESNLNKKKHGVSAGTQDVIIKKNNWILVVTAMYFGLKPNLFLVVFCFTCKAGPIFFF